jgi:hypothetical protein
MIQAQVTIMLKSHLESVRSFNILWSMNSPSEALVLYSCEPWCSTSAKSGSDKVTAGSSFNWPEISDSHFSPSRCQTNAELECRAHGARSSSLHIGG